MTLAIFPTDCDKQPTIEGFSFAPKNIHTKIETDSGETKKRAWSVGEVYVIKCTLKFEKLSDRQDFDDFYKYTIDYGNDWFVADWFVGLGFPADTQAFKFVSKQEERFGHRDSYKLTLLTQPKADAPDDHVDWPDTTPDGSYVEQRFGCITPSSKVVSSADSTHLTLDVDEVQNSRWRVDWVFALHDSITGERLSGPHTIDVIVGDTLTFSPAASPVPSIEHFINFANYDEVDDSQKIYAFFTDEENDFPSDGGLAYRMTYG